MSSTKQFSVILCCILICCFLLASSLPAAQHNRQSIDRIKYPPLSFSFPKPEKLSFKNGLTAHFLADQELPLVNISAVVRTGSIYDPVGKEGLAEITGAVMRSGGTVSMTSGEINRALDFTGTILEATVSRDSATISMSVLRDHLDSGLKIFSHILREPVFEEKQLELDKSLKTAALKRTLDDPDRLAFREFNRLIYRDNPRGRQARISSLKSISRQDTIAFHQKYFQPANTAIAVSGDITRAEAIQKLEQHLGDWANSSPLERELIPAPLTAGRPGAIYFIEKDTPQAVIIAGWIAPRKTIEQYYPFLMADFIVGSGGFRSRLFSEIRSARGLAYSTGSIYRAKSEYGIFVAYALTANKTAAGTLSLIKKSIDDFKGKPLPQNDLAWARNSINNAFIFSFLSAHQVARNYLMLEYDGLPNDYYHTYQNKIISIKSEEIKAMARQYLPWDEAIILVLGREKDFEGSLSEFGKVKKLVVNID